MTKDAALKLVKKYDFHILQFIERHQLFTKNDSLLVLVSGGADSLALLSFLIKNKFKVHGLYFHHGTRVKGPTDEHQIEINLIKKIFDQYHYSHEFLSVEFIQNLSLTENNFEEKARILRRKIVASKYSNYKYVLTGHHLNDSYEWWLRGRLTQNHADLPLGIPLVHGRWIKPFLCLSKKHILRYSKLLALDFHEDSSNEKLKFERNYLRKEIIKSIETKYPSYLKHYAAQSNLKAHKLNIHRLSKKMNSLERIKFSKIFENTYFLHFNQKISIDELIKLLTPFSLSKRGKWTKTLQQVFSSGEIEADQNLGLIGPISLSGSLHLWIMNKTLYLYLAKERPEQGLRELDEFLTNNFSHIPLRSDILTIFSLMKIDISPKKKMFSSKSFRGIKRILPRFTQLIEKIDHQIFRID